jgi:hypothetical protein
MQVGAAPFARYQDFAGSIGVSMLGGIRHVMDMVERSFAVAAMTGFMVLVASSVALFVL